MPCSNLQSHRIILLLLILAFGTAAVSAADLTGTVVDGSLVPVENVDIQLYTPAGDPIGGYSDKTDINGNYIINAVVAGDYGISFDPPTTDHAPFFGTLTVGAINLTYDLTLQTGFIISGVITDELAAPIPDIDLNVYDENTGDKLFTPGDNSDLVGFYDVVVPAGNYRITYRSTIGALWVPVEQTGVSVAGPVVIDVTMQAGHYISGTVTGPGATPVVDADLDAIISSTGEKIYTPSDNTDASGFYQILVPAGTFELNVSPLAADHLLPGVAYDLVVNGDVVADFNLVAGYLLSGDVTNSSLSPVANVDLDVLEIPGGARVFTPGDNTDAAGHYEIVVPPGNFDVFFEAPIAPPYLAPKLVESITVSADAILNVTLDNGVLVAGTVKDGGAVGIENVDFDLKDAVTGLGLPLGHDRTDATGAFATTVAPGIYTLEIEPPIATHLLPQVLSSVSFSQDTTLTITLDPGVLVSGMATDSSGFSVSGVRVDAVLSSTTDTAFTPGNQTDPSGFYQVLLASGSYDLGYLPGVANPDLSRVDLLGVDINADTTINVVLGGTPQEFTCGDANHDQLRNITDAVYLIQYIFNGGPTPKPLAAGDANCDSLVNITDAVFMIQYIFNGGPTPCDLNGDQVPDC